MPAWLVTLKTVLPYVTNIVTAAIPAFTARKDRDAGGDLVGRQILELQDAVTKNAESLRVLAEQLAQAVRSIDAGAGTVEHTLEELRGAIAQANAARAGLEARAAELTAIAGRGRAIALAALVLAIAALCAALFVMLRN